MSRDGEDVVEDAGQGWRVLSESVVGVVVGCRRHTDTVSGNGRGTHGLRTYNLSCLRAAGSRRGWRSWGDTSVVLTSRVCGRVSYPLPLLCRLDPQVFGRGGVSVMTLQYSSTGIGLITTTSLDPEKRRLKFPPRQIRGPTW